MKYVLMLLFCTYIIHEANSMKPFTLLSSNSSIPACFAFGNSILDTGNNVNLKTVFKSNFPPYGRDFPGGIPTGRFSNGKVVSDMIVAGLGIQALSPAYLDPNRQIKDFYSGANFASASSGYDPRTARISGTLTLSDQLELFKDYIAKLRAIVGEETTNNILNNSLYLVSTGTDDIALRNALLPNIIPPDILVSDLVIEASAFYKALHRLGARKIAILSSIVIGCTPLARTEFGGILRECSGYLNAASQLLNAKLSFEIDYLNSNLQPQSKLIYLDVYNPLLRLIEKPQLYGFSVVDKGCCGTGTVEIALLCNKFSPGTCTNASSYVFWDGGHPTERAYEIIVSDILLKLKKELF